MYLPRDEMAFRKEYEPLVVAHALKTVFRPGNRVYPKWRGYKPGEVVTARIIEKCGSDERGIPPVFNELKIPVQIDEIDVFHIDDLTDAHFEGSSPDVADVKDLQAHLSHIYKKPLTAFGNHVTRIGLSYGVHAGEVAINKAAKAYPASMA